MFLSDRDLQWAVERGLLIARAPEGVSPPRIDPSSIDLRLDHVDEAKIWDIKAYEAHVGITGEPEPVLNVGSYRYKIGDLSRFLVPPPDGRHADKLHKVYRQGSTVFVRSGGFLLWQTKEIIGTPRQDPRFICLLMVKARELGLVSLFT
jgi:deoxycytidine triphosphate deaminase